MSDIYTTQDGQTLCLGAGCAHMEDVIGILIEHLNRLQERVPGAEHRQIARALIEARERLRMRTERRRAAGVLGTDQPHVPLPPTKENEA